MKPEFSLALITGATSGIGEALAIFLAKKGINLILSGRNEEKLKSLQSTLGKQVSVQTIQADLSLPTDRRKVGSKIRELGPDLVINNAGFSTYGSALRFTTEQQVEIAQVDAIAYLELTLDAAHTLQDRGLPGVILNVSSAAAFHVLPRYAVYCASKAFVNRFSEAINEELHGTGIYVLASCPGVVITDFARRASGGKTTSAEQPMTMSVDFTVEQIWKQIQSRKPVHEFDWRYRFLTLLSKIVPQSLTFWLVRKGMEKRKAV